MKRYLFSFVNRRKDIDVDIDCGFGVIDSNKWEV